MEQVRNKNLHMSQSMFSDFVNFGNDRTNKVSRDPRPALRTTPHRREVWDLLATAVFVDADEKIPAAVETAWLSMGPRLQFVTESNYGRPKARLTEGPVYDGVGLTYAVTKKYDGVYDYIADLRREGSFVCVGSLGVAQMSAGNHRDPKKTHRDSVGDSFAFGSSKEMRYKDSIHRIQYFDIRSANTIWPGGVRLHLGVTGRRATLDGVKFKFRPLVIRMVDDDLQLVKWLLVDCSDDRSPLGYFMIDLPEESVIDVMC